jgi:ribose 5-phosphate isomerase B
VSRILISSDHAGVNLKLKIIEKFKDWNFLDLGPSTEDSVDYTDYAENLCSELIKQNPKIKDPGFDIDRLGFGILICGSGQGMAIKANRNQQIRAALCNNLELAKLSREHNDANVLCLGARTISTDLAFQIIDIFKNTPFLFGRHTQRVNKL